MTICPTTRFSILSSIIFVVFVRDNENNKISQVDLTLEGYSVPPLQAKYSEKAGAYYFDSIPKGYNIIIASKKNYEDVNKKAKVIIDNNPNKYLTTTVSLYTFIISLFSFI